MTGGADMAREAGAQERFVVAYTGAKFRYLLRRAMPYFLVFVAILAAYINDELRQIFSKGRAAPATAAGVLFLSVFVVAPILDIAFTLATFRRGRPALIISKEGVEGPILHRMQRFAWDDIADIFSAGADLLVERKPQNIFEAFTAAHAARGGRHRITQTIRTPLACVDKTAIEIHVALAKFDPRAARPLNAP